MQRGRVVVADELGNVKAALRDQGYEVLGMSALNQNPDAVIISGLNENIIGMEDMQANTPVISAHGLSANEVISVLRERMKML